MKISISKLQPSEVILSERKLARARWMYDNNQNKPIIVSKIEDGYAIVDGNHRVYVAKENGSSKIEVIVEKRNMDEIVSLMVPSGIVSISDLSDKVVNHDEWRKAFPKYNMFEDELDDNDFFEKHPELEKYCSYR